ncbi:MAG: hypothetical protein IPK26_11975 [Planctomycetes bacterium]|nr:hypothetical protein [Planctomycetota bacterium]
MRSPLSLLLLATLVQAQDTKPPLPCQPCTSHGELPCKAHGKGVLELEKVVRFCSVAADCKTCQGALATDCKSCRNQPAETALAERVKLAQQLLTQRRKDIDAVIDNKPLLHLTTEHLDLVFSIRPLTIGRDKIETHPLMHLYGQRIEALRTLFLQTFDVPDGDLPGRLRIHMFRDEQDHAFFGPRVTGMGGGSSTGTKLMGAECVYSMWHDPRGMPDDEALHRTIIHNTSHLLLSNMTPAVWLGNRKHGWIDEGLAHWFEDKLTGKCTNFCYEEIALTPGAGFKGGRWRVPVRKLVDDGKARSFAELSALNTDQLDFQDHAMVFACVDFLITAHGGPKFRDLVRLIKRDKPTRDALQEVYGLNPLTFDTRLHEWVKATYPLQER